MSDAELLRAFEHCTLSPSCWTHEAHVRVAWLYLKHHDELTALQLIRTGIQRYNANVLKKTVAYHETITVTCTRLIADRRSELAVDHSFADFKLAAGELLDRKLSALLMHYRHETLYSDKARKCFVPPDLQPLPIAALQMTVRSPS